MPELILRTDDGPDILVNTEQQKARVEIVCGKTSKVVGHCVMYAGYRNVLIYSHDRRRKAGTNRQAWLFSRDHLNPAEVLARCGGGYEYKELLRKAGYDGPMVTSLLDLCVISEAAE